MKVVQLVRPRVVSVCIGLLFSAHAMAAVTVSPVNHITDSNVGGTRTIYFRTAGSGACATQFTYPPNGASLDPNSDTDELIFNISTSTALRDIKGSDPVNDGDIAIRVEVDGTPATDIPLFDHSNGYSISNNPYFVNYGVTSGATKTFGISLDGVIASIPTTVSGFCDLGLLTCSQAPGVRAGSKTLRFMLISKSATNSSGTTLEDMSEAINIVLGSCPETMGAGGTLSVPDLNFGLINGDERVQVANSTVPPADDQGLPLTKLVVYGEATSSANALSITSSIRREFEARQGVFTVDGLANETQYCFSLGWVNAAGLVSTQDGAWGATLPPGHCATPSRIDGFLDRSTCFIASAAYGDEWHPRLETLRQFRDQILAQTDTGKAFIAWYYSWSPRAAHWLMERPGYRLAVRAALFPVVEGARAALWLRYNMWALGVVLVLGTASLVAVRLREGGVHAD